MQNFAGAVCYTAYSLSILCFCLVEAKAAIFPVDTRGVQATIVAVSGLDTASALAIGQIQDANLHEYCNRDPGGITIRYGGSMSISQCVAQMAREMGGRKFSSSANCPYKLVTVHWGPTYRLVSKTWNDGYEPGRGYWDYVWRDSSKGVTLDGSSASGAPTVSSTFEMLCPSF